MLVYEYTSPRSDVRKKNYTASSGHGNIFWYLSRTSDKNTVGEAIQSGKKIWKLFLFSLKIKGIKCEVISPLISNKWFKTVL